MAEPAPVGALTRAAADGRPRARADGPRLVVQAWLGSRVLLILAALWIARTTGRSASDLLANWDVQHFFAIALRGYAAPNDIAFFPGWPLVLRGLAGLGVPLLWAGVALAVAASALAAAALYRLGGVIPAVAWLLVPTTVFTFVPYTEAAFCAAAFWAWERATRGRWAAATGLAALACTVRVSGLFLVAALAVLALTGRFGPTTASPRAARPERLQALAWLAFPAATLAAYSLFLYLTTGSWTAWYDAQAAGWARGFTWPWESLANTWRAATSTDYPAFPEWSWVFRAEIVSMALGLVTTLICLLRRRWAEATWVGSQVVAFAFSYWFFSVNRAVLLWFPLFLLLGEAFDAPWWTTGRWRRLVRIAIVTVLVAGAVAGVLGWAWLFFTGRWAS